MFNFEVWCQRLRRYIRDLVHFRMTENNGQVKAVTETRNWVAPQLCTRQWPTHPSSVHTTLFCRHLRDQRSSVHCHIMRDLLVMRISHTCDVDRLASHLSLFSRGQLESIGPPKECSESVYKNIELLKLVVFGLFTDNNLHKEIHYSWRAGRYHGGGE